MNNRERALAILNYQNYDRVPVVHFGYWRETLLKWADEGHISADLARECNDGNAADAELDAKLGFDFCWATQASGAGWRLLSPPFEHRVLETRADGTTVIQNGNGLIEATKPGVTSIPQTIGTLMTGREAWEQLYRPRLQFNLERLQPNPADAAALARVKEDFATDTYRPKGIFVGSLIGIIRDMLGVEGLSYLYADDEDLYAEIIDTVGNLYYDSLKALLEAGLRADFLHFWEDICFNNGPLVTPESFEQHVCPHYRRLTRLGAEHGIGLVSVDCDGLVDKLVPLWLSHGVNIMFPIEVGTWHASLAPWRERYGRELRGVGGMNKNVLARDRAAIDAEIERLKPLVALGGYLPCPDHRIPPEATWDNTRYYCDRMREVFAR